MFQNAQTCSLEANSTRIGIKLPVDIVYCVNHQLTLCIVYGLHSHTQRARLQTRIAVTKNTKIRESTRESIRDVYTSSGSLDL